jgi:hypothetical protein
MQRKRAQDAAQDVQQQAQTVAGLAYKEAVRDHLYWMQQRI